MGFWLLLRKRNRTDGLRAGWPAVRAVVRLSTFCSQSRSRKLYFNFAHKHRYAELMCLSGFTNFTHIIGRPTPINQLWFLATIRFRSRSWKAMGGDMIWKNQLNQIQKGRLSAIMNFNMPDIGQTVSDSIARLLKWYKMLGFRWGYVLNNFNSIIFKMADYWSWLTLIYFISGQQCQIADHYYKTKCAILWRKMTWKKFN